MLKGRGTLKRSQLWQAPAASLRGPWRIWNPILYCLLPWSIATRVLQAVAEPQSIWTLRLWYHLEHPVGGWLVRIGSQTRSFFMKEAWTAVISKEDRRVPRCSAASIGWYHAEKHPQSKWTRIQISRSSHILKIQFCHAHKDMLAL
jgi:hypothetical protein